MIPKTPTNTELATNAILSGGDYFDAFTGDAMFNITGVPSGINDAGSGRRISVSVPP